MWKSVESYDGVNLSTLTLILSRRGRGKVLVPSPLAGEGKGEG
jgi:hypothetical protein